MRRPRLKPDHQPIFYHLFNRVAGETGYLPFGPKEKEHFVRLLHKLDRFYTIRVVAYQVMSNHFHLVAYVPDEAPEPEEVCRRYNAFYRNRPKLKPSDPYCALIGSRMRDISCYMHALQQPFSTWFNRTRPNRRRGHLWAERFKNTLLGDAQAVWECCKYIEMNPVRAKMVKNPADYRFCSFGAWSGKGRHPFARNVRECLLPWLEGQYAFRNTRQLRDALRDVFAEVEAAHAEPDGKVSPFTVHLDRRVRYWVDGLVIGSELFVQDIVLRCDGILRTRRRGFPRARAPDLTAMALCSYKQLRAL